MVLPPTRCRMQDFYRFTPNLRYFCVLLILQCFLALQDVKSQTPEIKQLITKSQRAVGKEKIDLLSELSYRFYPIDPQKGIQYGQQALKLAGSQNIPKAKSKAFNNLGTCYLVLSNHDSARYCFTQALQIAQLYNDTFELATAHNRMGVLCEKTGLYDSALQSFHLALPLFRQLKDLNKSGLIHNNIGTIHLHRGELKTALTSFLEAESIFRNAGITSQVPKVCMGIGIVYSETGDYTNAEKWYTKGKQTAIENEDFQAAGLAINALGILFKNQNKYQEALKNYRDVIEMGDKVNTDLLLAALGNSGNVYQKMGDFRSALNYHQQALKIAQRMNNPVLTAEQYVGMGIAYNSLLDYQQASHSFKKALPAFSTSGSFANLLVTYEGLIEASNGLKDFKQSVEYYKNYLSIKDTLNSKELNTALDSLKVKFNTEHTLRENMLLSKDNQTQAKIITLQRTVMVSAFVFAALLLSLVIIVIRSRRSLSRANKLLVSKNEEISAASAEIRNKNEQLTEFSKYKDSMNSFLVHDLKNPLNSIIHFDPENFTNQQAEGVRQSGLQMLNIVSNLLDISKHANCKMKLYNEDTSLVQIIHQAFRETDFLARQKSIHMVLESRSDYILNADAGIIKRVIINIFTNAIKFSTQGGRIRILPELMSPFMVKISITDEGDGIAPDYLPFVFNQFTQGIPRKSGFSASTGIGLAFCKMAVEAHGGEIGVISSPGNGATFWFSLPLSQVHSQISEQQQFPELTENLTPVLKVTTEDKDYLEVFCKNFENVSVYQFTEAKEILKTLEERSPGLSQWKSLLLEALIECNELKFKDLIQVCYE